MCQLSALNNPQQPLIGIDLNIFHQGQKETQLVHKDLVMNMLHHVDSRNHGILDWASYLRAMTLIRPYDLETKIDSLISTVIKPISPSRSFVQRMVED